LLTRLKKRSESTQIDMYIPSANDTLKFKPLSVKQQADIISGVLHASKDTNIYAYQNTIDEIILNNVSDEDIHRVKSFDRAFILIQYRVITMGETIEIQEEQHDLIRHVDEMKQLVVDDIIFSKTVTYEGITIECISPQLQHEYNMNREVPRVYKNTSDREQVSNIFKVELSKFIKSVSFDDHTLDFAKLTLKQKTQICDMLPMSLSQQVVQFVELLREQESVYTTIITEHGSTDIPIDSQLFDR
jgi:hypothetical protein